MLEAVPQSGIVPHVAGAHGSTVQEAEEEAANTHRHCHAQHGLNTVSLLQACFAVDGYLVMDVHASLNTCTTCVACKAGG